MIYPYRNKSTTLSKDGQKKHRNTYSRDDDRAKLKKRYLIENIFASLKQFRRLGYVYERDIICFKGFVYLTCYLMNSKF